MRSSPAAQRHPASLLHRYSAELVKMAQYSRAEAMSTLARREAELAAEAVTVAAQAQAENRNKDAFLAHIGHEVRTPLNAIIGFSEIIQGLLPQSPDNDKIREYARDISSAAWHLNRVVSDVLDFAKIEAGKLVLQEAPVEFIRILQASHTMVRERQESKAIVFVTRIAAAPTLQVDEVKFRQILINLFSNAVKFTPAGGTIAVDTELGSDRRFVLRVRDTGIGIAPADLPKIFTPFNRLGPAKDYDGTGLGLSLSRSFIELHGGSIAIESTPGTGTVATIHLPAARVLTDLPPRPRDGDSAARHPEDLHPDPYPGATPPGTSPFDRARQVAT